MERATSEYHQSKSAIEIEMEWIAKAKENPKAFAPIYDKYFEPIFRYVDNRTSDRNLAEDLTAQVFIKALSAIQSFQPQGVPFGSWLYRIASNVIHQHFRDAAKNRSVSLQEEQLHFLTDVSDDKEEKELLFEKVKKALDTLKEKDLALIEMRFFEDRSFKEIGEILGIEENTAKVRSHRVVEKLRKKLMH